MASTKSFQNGNDKLDFLRSRHIKYFQRCVNILPFQAATFDSSRVTVLFFALSGLDLLNALDVIPKEEHKQIIDWIYMHQVSSKYDDLRGGFRGGNTLSTIPADKIEHPKFIKDLDCGHIAMTYTALASLLILGDDLSRVDREGIQNHIRLLQCEDGSFFSTAGGSENDMRFVYCASAICYMLQDYTALNIDAAVKYIKKSIGYDGAIAQGPCQESHGGSTYCGIAALVLMDKLGELSSTQKDKLIRWLIFHQDSEEGGLQGRPNKPADTCYSFWVGATLKLLNAFQFLDHGSLVNFVLSTQDPITGGLGKYKWVFPDGLHTYLGISGLSLIDNDISKLDLNTVDPSLNLSKRAFEHLQKLHRTWKATPNA